MYPITVNFGHSLSKHHTFNYHPKELSSAHKTVKSCAIYHCILNYNVPLLKSSFLLFAPNEISELINSTKKTFIKISIFYKGKRAPPTFIS